MKNLLIVLFITIILSSCGDKVRENLMPNVTGKAGEVVLVIEKGYWEGAIGDTLRAYFMQAQIGLPQTEPLVDLVNIPSNAFSDIFKTHRNIIQTYVSNTVEKSEVLIKRDFHAKPQLFVSIEAKNEAEFMDLIMKNRERILAAILKIERERILSTYKKYPERGLRNHLLKTHQLSVTMPRGYRLRLDSTEFLWYSYETQLTSQGLFINYYDYTDTSQLNTENLIRKRNVLLRKYVPGPTEGSYMITEDLLPVQRKEFTFKGNYAVELRGLWKLENDFMGGPFVSFTTVDEERNRIVTVDGYVYAPKFDKRNYLRQMEALLHTLEFPAIEEEKK